MVVQVARVRKQRAKHLQQVEQEHQVREMQVARVVHCQVFMVQAAVAVQVVQVGTVVAP
jgi:hypothetical protein